MTDVHCVAQVEVLDELCQIVGIRFDVVALLRLCRTSVTPAIVRVATITAQRQKEHLEPQSWSDLS